MIYSLQVTQPGKHKMDTDLTSSNRRRVYDRMRQVTDRGQQARVRDSAGRVLDVVEVQELR